MRKITLFLMSLFLVVGAMAQTPINFAEFDNTKAYRIYNKAIDKGDSDWMAMSYNNSNKGCLKVYDANDSTQMWKFIPVDGVEGGYRLCNVKSEKYLAGVGGNSGVAMVEETNAMTYHITPNEDGTKVAFWHSNVNEPRNYLWNDGNNNLFGWKDATNQNHMFYLEVVADSKVEFTYQYKYNDDVKWEETVTAYIGSAYPNLRELPLGILASKPEGNVEEAIGGTVVEIDLTVGDLPFEYFATAEDVIKNNAWYNLVMHSNEGTAAKYRTYLGVGDETKLAWGEKRTLMNAGDDYYWGFVGDPFNGFQVINKAKAGYFLTSNGSDNPTMVVDGTTTWTLAARKYDVNFNGDYVQKGEWFCLKHTNGSYMNGNANNGVVNFWTDNDNGSAILAVKPITIKASADVATYFSETAIKVPAVDGLEINYANKVENGYVKLEQITNIVNPETGIVVLYETEEDLTFAPEIVSPTDATVYDGNLLKGTTKQTLITKETGKEYYALGMSEGIGFYRAVNGTNEGEFYNGAFKAYLEVETAGQSAVVFYSFDFGGNTTAIESVVTPTFDANAPIYDLSGRRVVNAVKGGLYIQNGKKFIVK